jgi:cellulose synthase/poly-beta-1,6-N-acetylglucosamine synthase-like glycosyltransferase
MIILPILFWMAIVGIVYTLLIYPFLTIVLAAIVRRKVDKKPVILPVSFIIAAYNEEQVIADKIEKTLALDYPSDKLEIIIASDGCTDRTDEIVRSFATRGVKLNRVEGRKGKNNALNETVKIATGDILIFSDATSVFNYEAIRELVANFNDPAVGCVTGRVAYSYGKDVTSRGFKFYQKFVVRIRRSETYFGSQTSVSGAIHAIRRDLFRPVNPIHSADIIDAVHTVTQGYRVIYENNAVAVEESRTSIKEEFQCRLRIGIRSMSMTSYILSQLAGSRKFAYMFQMISHKIFRWWLWSFLLVAFIMNLVLVFYSPIYLILACVQAVLYVMGILGIILSSRRLRLPFLDTFAYFLLANSAMSLATFKYFTGKRMATWEPVR